ncbi:cbb3-type cytochrome c oxidase subunit II [Cobetia sp. QF-1]|uniref:cbb3-type cytochrome c oxidase subunit II n=1 Tax=Cobetia sp. QF-1 TaxID=1969833 RepID=UPI000B53CA32|nr:cbb3-type cytochrome c oxidase subunit II [Cobetia sp. QF-1]
MRHVLLERHAGLMTALCLITMSLGALAQLLPLGFQTTLSTPSDGLKPLDALALEGRDIYRREGCQQCHTRVVRDLPGDYARYGAAQTSSDLAFDRPSLWGNARHGPDLSRLPLQHDEAWQRVHLYSPRTKVPDSSMPGYPWLFEQALTGQTIAARMRKLQALGAPYRDDEILAAPSKVRGVAEATALLAYLRHSSQNHTSSDTALAASGQTEESRKQTGDTP